ncbi:MAG: hypothetical protein ABSC19_06910 [Syntrophorhabdales bacterium]|jgi:hypothetical protein
MEDDFAHYVIGSNSEWLPLGIDEPIWQSPDERLTVLLEELSADEKSAWGTFKVAEDEVTRFFRNSFQVQIRKVVRDEQSAVMHFPRLKIVIGTIQT